MAQVLNYFYLKRFHKPIGFFLLLWPTLWAIWLASGGHPDIKILSLLVGGVFLTRSAGCILNDIWDRNFDVHVTRTKDRPLAAKKISVGSGLLICFVLMLASLWIVLQLNPLCFFLSLAALALMIVYPLLKRITHLPQLGLGVAFSLGIPMSFAAIQNQLPWQMWVLFSASILWPVIYDSYYALVDQKEDLRIGVKSTAILFGKNFHSILMVLQIVFLMALIGVGVIFNLNYYYFSSLLGIALLFLYQNWISKQRPFDAFLHNNWVGCMLFLGIFLGNHG